MQLMMNNGTGELIGALAAQGPHPSLAQQARVFARLIGTWDADYTEFHEDGSVRRNGGEVTFGWVLDGRAVQDVWTWRTNGGESDARGIGTTVRFFDAALGKWRIVWIVPAAGLIRTLIGGAVGDRIVFEGAGGDGVSLRWSFNEITDESFVWRGEESRDGGKTWRMADEYRMTRRKHRASAR